MYIIQRKENEFVSWPGSQNSYTKFLQHARYFLTREAALKEKCGNETIVHLEALMSREGGY